MSTMSSMRLRFPIYCLVLAAFWRAGHAAEVPRDRSPQDVLVFSSLHETAGFRRPTPDQPAYYLAMAGGYHAEGPQMARDHADQVTADAVWPALEKALAAQGYRRAMKDTPK